jgi:hypothetical protein
VATFCHVDYLLFAEKFDWLPTVILRLWPFMEFREKCFSKAAEFSSRCVTDAEEVLILNFF